MFRRKKRTVQYCKSVPYTKTEAMAETEEDDECHFIRIDITIQMRQVLCYFLVGVTIQAFSFVVRKRRFSSKNI